VVKGAGSGEVELFAWETAAVRGEHCIALAALARAPALEWDLHDVYGIPPALYRVFLLESDLSVHRRAASALRSISDGSLADVAAFDAGYGEWIRNVRRSGLLAEPCLPTVSSRLLLVRARDAEAVLVGFALRAARHRLEHGRYPRSTEELGDVPSHVLVEGDGAWVRLTDTSAHYAEPPQIELPPEPKPGLIR